MCTYTFEQRHKDSALRLLIAQNKGIDEIQAKLLKTTKLYLENLDEFFRRIQS